MKLSFLMDMACQKIKKYKQNVLLVNKLIFMQKIEIGETAKFLVI